MGVTGQGVALPAGDARPGRALFGERAPEASLFVREPGYPNLLANSETMMAPAWATLRESNSRWKGM